MNVCLGDRAQTKRFNGLDTLLGLDNSRMQTGSERRRCPALAFTSRHHVQHTLTVWTSKKHMLAYKSSLPMQEPCSIFQRFVAAKYRVTKLMPCQIGMRLWRHGINMGNSMKACHKQVTK